MSVGGILTAIEGQGFFVDFHYVTARIGGAPNRGSLIFEGTIDAFNLLNPTGAGAAKSSTDAGVTGTHLVFAVNCENPSFHDPEIVRHGESLWGDARGFFLNTDGINQVYAERWNSSPSPDIVWLGDSGYPNQFVTDEQQAIHWRVEARTDANWWPHIAIWLRDTSSDGELLFYNTMEWGWEPRAEVKCAIGLISTALTPAGQFTMDAFFEPL